MNCKQCFYSGLLANLSGSRTTCSFQIIGRIICALLAFLLYTSCGAVDAFAEEVALSFLSFPYPAGTTPKTLDIADFNGDSKLDIAVGNRDSGEFSILFQQADKTFGEPQTYPVAADQVVAVVSADLDSDLDVDLAVVSNKNLVQIFRNNGTGDFESSQTINVAQGPESIAIGDLDEDGDLDLATANARSDDVSILLNEGGGTFSSEPKFYPVGSGDNYRSYYVTTVKLNNDEFLDLAVANLNDNSISILFNNGKGEFSVAQEIPLGGDDSNPYEVRAADFDGNGFLDLASVNAFSNSVAVWLNDGMGNLTKTTINCGEDSGCGIGFLPKTLTIGDWNGDTVEDIAVISQADDRLTLLLGQDILTQSQEGGVTFQVLTSEDELIFPGVATDSSKELTQFGDAPNYISSSDFDGDGDLDLAIANRDANNIEILLNQRLSPSPGD